MATYLVYFLEGIRMSKHESLIEAIGVAYLTTLDRDLYPIAIFKKGKKTVRYTGKDLRELIKSYSRRYEEDGRP